MTLSKSCKAKGYSGDSLSVRYLVSTQNDSVHSVEVDLNELRQKPSLVATVNRKRSSMGLTQLSDSYESESSKRVLTPGSLCRSGQS